MCTAQRSNNWGLFQFYKSSYNQELSTFWSVSVVPQYKNQNVLPEFLGILKSKSTIRNKWKNLISDMIESEILSEILLEETMKIWVNMKMKQIIDLCIFKLKQAKSTSLSKQETPALRKTLDKFF